MTANCITLIIGLILLYLGSEWMIKGSSSLALSFSIRPIIVGLTIVAFATSAPELLVSLVAAAKGSSGVSVGNIIGSNIINISLVLGSCALIKPMTVDSNLVKRELPYMVVVTFVFWFMCLDGNIGRTDGTILLVLLCAFIIYGIFTAKDNNNNFDKPEITSYRDYLVYISLIVIGLTCLAIGADYIVKSAIFIARTFGFSELFIGLSIVAIGTSLPELATSVVAAKKKESDLSVGNIVGSNLFNICLVMGTVGLLSPINIDAGLNRFEFPFMLTLTVLLLIFLKSGHKLSRTEGLLFFLSFFIYIGGAYWLSVK